MKDRHWLLWFDRFWAVAGAVSVRTKIMGIVLGLVLGLGMAVTLQARHALRQTMQGELQEQSVSIARDVAARATDLILINDLYGLHQLLVETQANNADVRYAFVVNPAGEVLAHTFGEGFPDGLLNANAVGPEEHRRTVRLATDEGTIWDTAVPVFKGEAGTARVGLTEASVERAVNAVTGQLLLTTALVSAAGIVGAGFLTWVLTRPIRRLVEAAQAVGRGEFGQRVPRWAGDEIGDLAEAFNEMAAALGRAAEARQERDRLRAEFVSGVMAAQEEERKRISRELHDSTSQALTSLMVGLRSLSQTCPSDEVQRRVEGNGWFISGLEIDHAEIGLYVPSGGARYWIEDMYFHDILGLFMPIVPGWEELCATSGCPMWDPFPSPSWGNAIHFKSADYVTVRDIVIERATGGIGGFANVGWVENVFIDKATNGGLNFNGNSVTMRYATILNGQWPSGAWYGADPFISNWDSGWAVERSEVAYTNNYDYIPGVNPGVQDASPVDFDLDSVNSAVRDNFFHDNVGPCFEFNMASGGNRNIVIANNVCYNNGLEDDPSPPGDYSRIAFIADACGFHAGQSYIVRDNLIYKAFPGQSLNYYFDLEAPGANPFANDFRHAEQACGTVVSNNAIFEYGEYTLPLPVPAPPPIAQTDIAAAARVTVSSGAETAALAQDGSLDTEWVSAEAQPWIRYEWGSPQTIDTIRLFDRPDLDNWATSGVLTFSDGSSINVTGGILNNGAMREVIFDSPKTVTWAQFTVTRNAPAWGNPDLYPIGSNVGLTELQVYLAASPPPPAPTPDPGTFTVDFSDRPETPAELFGPYPENANGIDWSQAGWTSTADPATGTLCLH